MQQSKPVMPAEKNRGNEPVGRLIWHGEKINVACLGISATCVFYEVIRT